MATKSTKISDLTALTGANSATDDEFVIVDTSGVETKRMTRAELIEAIAQNLITLDVTGSIEVGNGEGLSFGDSSYRVEGSSATNPRISFITASTERIRISSSGNIAFQNNIQNSSHGLIIEPSGDDRDSLNCKTSSTGQSGLIHFTNPNGMVGYIAANGSSTQYITSSDYRLKEDIQPLENATDRLLQLKPVNFAWKVDGSRVDGFLAHEAQAVVPEAVTGNKDAMRDEEYEVTPAVLGDDGEVVTEAVMGTRSVPNMQGIDQSKIVPLLTAALKEALTRIEALEAAL